MRLLALAVIVLFAIPVAIADDARAEFNYMMHCQGCHGPGGEGGSSVPVMTDFVGHFATTGEGRAYLVQVPGSAYSVLDDARLAEVLNWLMVRFSGDSLPVDYQVFTEEEVGEYRQYPLEEMVGHRARLLNEIARELDKPEIASQ